MLLYAPNDVRTAKFLIENSEDNEALTAEERDLNKFLDVEKPVRPAAAGLVLRLAGAFHVIPRILLENENSQEIA